MSNWIEDDNKTRDIFVILTMIISLIMISLINTGVIL
jgi:hypothetical protein